MNDDPDFDVEGPEIEYVSYGPEFGPLLNLLFILALILLVVAAFLCS